MAVVFDFDDTLLPDSTTALLSAHGIDTDEFWKELAPELVAEGYDPPLAYLRLILDRVGDGQPLGPLRSDDLVSFGASLDTTFFPGLPQLFQDLRDEVAGYRSDDRILHRQRWLEAVIAGSRVVEEHFSGFYGCRLGGDGTGIIRYVMRCVTFTEKTRFLFEINKGIRPADSRNQPHLVTQRASDRRIPFENMIYVGDGLTDVPCFSLVSARGGKTFGVFKPGKESAKQAFQRLLDTHRVDSLHSPDYREDADLGSLIRAAVATVAAIINLQAEQTYRH
jgi:phosphoserine phosphatase